MKTVWTGCTNVVYPCWKPSTVEAPIGNASSHNTDLAKVNVSRTSYPMGLPKIRSRKPSKRNWDSLVNSLLEV